MDLPQLRAAIAEAQSRTDHSFGVNLRADQPDAGQRVDLLIGAGVKVASFALAPKPDLIAPLKAGVVVIPSVGAKRHAEKVAALGVDAVLVQGREGAGTPDRWPRPCSCGRSSMPSRSATRAQDVTGTVRHEEGRRVTPGSSV